MFGKSLFKAFRDAGQFVGGAAIVAAAGALANPEFAASLVALGPAGPAFALVAGIASRAALDYLKHRPKEAK